MAASLNSDLMACILFSIFIFWKFLYTCCGERFFRQMFVSVRCSRSWITLPNLRIARVTCCAASGFPFLMFCFGNTVKHFALAMI